MRFANNQCVVIRSQDKSIYTGRCVFCNSPVVVVVKNTELDEYNKGNLIQNAMPSLNDDEREFLISGICPDCFPK